MRKNHFVKQPFDRGILVGDFSTTKGNVWVERWSGPDCPTLVLQRRFKNGESQKRIYLPLNDFLRECLTSARYVAGQQQTFCGKYHRDIGKESVSGVKSGQSGYSFLIFDEGMQSTGERFDLEEADLILITAACQRLNVFFKEHKEVFEKEAKGRAEMRAANKTADAMAQRVKSGEAGTPIYPCVETAPDAVLTSEPECVTA